MRCKNVLLSAVKALSFANVSEKKRLPDLAKLDRGVLTVGLLIAALDGTILPEEYESFTKLARNCRGGSIRNVRLLFDEAIPVVGNLMAMAQIKVYSVQERLAVFLQAARNALPAGFANGTLADLRRAFALWVMVGVADGAYSAIEKTAIHALLYRLATVRTKKGARNPQQAYRLIEINFLSKLEKLAREFSSPAKRTKAEAELREFIVSAPAGDGKGEPFPFSSVHVPLCG